MQIDLQGKKAFVSGSTRGIGFGIAAGLAACGAQVIVNGRSQSAVEEALLQLKSAVPEANCVGIAADVATADGCDAIANKFPDLDILVNNTGIYAQKDFYETSDADWQQYFETNVMSGVRLSRHYVSGMHKRNWGRIVFISSESALLPLMDMVPYGVSKIAQIGLSRGLAELTAGSGVTVNSVLPGPTLTSGGKTYIEDYAKAHDLSLREAERLIVKASRPGSLLQRFVTVEEVANMVVYLCSAQASATNGAALRVEGGTIPTAV
jgi:NAD(P)-dependent dehydrogenase (short-subunit alcohol dehydrogenase family)